MAESSEEITLSAGALRALNDFLLERQISQCKLSDEIEENWQLSQFWYDESTSRILAEEIWQCTEADGWIACVSCPSIYKALLNRQLDERDSEKRKRVLLFEYDERFRSLYKEDYIFYDYNHPECIAASLRERFSYIAADPPFLSEDCLTNLITTIDLLKRPGNQCKILLCTGEIMEEKVESICGFNKTSFIPVHKSKLSNSFASFTNYVPVVLNSSTFLTQIL